MGRQHKYWTQAAWAVMVRYTEGWTVSGVEFNRDAALGEMERQREMLPAFDYKVVPCRIWVTGPHLKAPAMTKQISP